MPAPNSTKRSGRRRRNKPSKAWYDKKYSAMQIAGKAWSTAQYLKGLINVERKFLDVNQSGDTINWNGTVAQLANINQGDGVNQRDGQSVLLKSILIRGAITYGSVHGSNLIRVVVFMDKRNSTGVFPSPLDVYANVGNANAPNSPLLNNSYGRFKILYTNLFTVSDTGQKARPFKIYINHIDKHIHYTGTAGTDESRNQIYIMYTSDVNTDDPSISYYSRIRYIDN